MTDHQPSAEPAQTAHLPETPAQSAPHRPRPRLLDLLRWGAALLALGLSGTATALAVTAPDRTDLPGLRTSSDGRYAFPELTLPALPAGKPSPFASGNEDGHHSADLRGLLLPAPKGAAAAGSPPPPAVSAKDCDAAQALFEDPVAARVALFEAACRRSTARTWTAADGTRTEIRLLAFGSSAEAGAFHGAMVVDLQLKALPGATMDTSSKVTTPEHVSATTFFHTRSAGGTDRNVAQAAHLIAGDIVATIVMTNPGGVPDVAFRQVVTLQAELLE